MTQSVAENVAVEVPENEDPSRFRVRLLNFEGPFDLLLTLISQHRLDVTEVALHTVTDDFIAFTKSLGREMGLDQTTEFLVVAATLLDLKAARLLPSGDVEDAEDLALLEAVDAALVTAGSQIHRVELRAALRTGMGAAAAVNAYLNATEPWKLAKVDPERANVVLGTALAAVVGVRVALAPYLPFSTSTLDDVLGPVDSWERRELSPGSPIGKPTPLFAKVDLDVLLSDQVDG